MRLESPGGDKSRIIHSHIVSNLFQLEPQHLSRCTEKVNPKSSRAARQGPITDTIA